MALNTKAIWERAIPLHRAFWHFAPAAEKAQYESLAAATSTPAIVQRWETGQVSIAEALGPFSERGKLANRLRALCLRYIQDGHLRAFGFDEPRRSYDLPREIPSELWAFPIPWDKDKLVGNGLEMVAVRLIPSKWIIQLEGLSEEPARRAGRPSREAQIIDAWTALSTSGELDFGAPKTNAYRLIRQTVLDLYPDQGATGLGDDALRKILKPYWDRHLSEKL